MTLNQQDRSGAASIVIQGSCGSRDGPAWMDNNIPWVANYSPVCHKDQPEASLWSNYYNSVFILLRLKLITGAAFIS